MLAAILLIAALVTIIYIISIIPYLFVTQPAATSGPIIQMIIPISSLLIIAVIAFLVPRRKRQEKQAVEMTGQRVRDSAEHTYRIKLLSSGAIAGFFASLVLVGLVFAGDAIAGLPLGTFYSVTGVAMAGLPIASAVAVFFGIALHLVVGTAIGAVFGYLTEIIGPFNIDGVAKGAAVGILAGFASFSGLFIPLTVLGGLQNFLAQVIAPMYPSTTSTDILQSRVVDIMSIVLAGAIVLHVVYGAILGTFTALLLGYRLKVARKIQEGKEKEDKEKDKQAAEKRHWNSESTAA